MSDDPIDSIFDQAGARPAPAESAALKDVRWHERVVLRLLTCYGLHDEAIELRRLTKSRTGRGRLTFAGFFERHPNFPVWLETTRIQHLHRLSVYDWFHVPTKTAVFQAWVAAEACAPGSWREDGLPIGVVFEWLHGVGMGVIHNYNKVQAEGRTCIMTTVRGVRYWVESIDGFLEGLGWTPR